MDNKYEGEIKLYIENPDGLISFCEDVINGLLAKINDNELRQMQAQLIEVSRSIDQLTKLSINIPDELRNLKLNLLNDIETQSQNKEKLEKLLLGLQDLITLTNTTYFPKSTPKKRGRKRKAKSNLPYTKQDVYRDEVIDALKILGGSGTPKEVKQIIEQRMKGKFLPGDFEKRARGMLVWKNNVHWARLALKNDGIIRDDSPKGVWELSEGYK